MYKKTIKEYISDILDEMISEAKLDRIIDQCITEAKGDDEGESNTADIKRNTVMKLLQNNRLKDSQFAYALWHPKDQSEKDTYRSLFSKKVNGEPDDDGNIRQFSDDEISKLYELLRNSK